MSIMATETVRRRTTETDWRSLIYDLLPDAPLTKVNRLVKEIMDENTAAFWEGAYQEFKPRHMEGTA